MIDYPASLPTDALLTLLDVVRGKIDSSKAIHAGWNILGYGLSQGFPVQQGIGDYSEEEASEALQILIADDHPEAVGFPSVAFAVVLKLALKIVLSALS